MGSLYDDDDEEFDLAAVEARHEELEALEALDTREGQLVLDIPGCQNGREKSGWNISRK